jgi:hypothetical protein
VNRERVQPVWPTISATVTLWHSARERKRQILSEKTILAVESQEARSPVPPGRNEAKMPRSRRQRQTVDGGLSPPDWLSCIDAHSLLTVSASPRFYADPRYSDSKSDALANSLPRGHPMALGRAVLTDATFGAAEDHIRSEQEGDESGSNLRDGNMISMKRTDCGWESPFGRRSH